jgi:peptidoglycan/xylan/chitin deacetylase (PgdA/CDA1 family)
MSFFYRRVAASLFSSVLWHTDDPTVHLTFDDGPHPTATPIVLDILKSRHLEATFFLLGGNVQRYPELAREIAAQGHSIGNHAFVHSSLMLQSYSSQLRQIELTNKVIEQATGTLPRLFRPPFGRFDLRTIRAASSQHLKTVMWDVDSKDYSGSDVPVVVRRVCQQTIPGSIVLFHDSEPTSATLPEYLNPILDDLERRNVKFSSLVL